MWLVWLACNAVLIRPFFRMLNDRALDGWRCPPLHPDRDANGTRTLGLEVVLAGVGRSGTTSMQAALEELGLRTYKSIEVAFYLPGLLRNASSAVPLEGLGAAVRSCGVKAIAPEPLYAVTPQLVQLSPGVKVIFTWRDWETLHWSSRRALISKWLLADLALPLMCDWMPYAAVWPTGDPGHSFLDASLSSLLIEHCRRGMMKTRPVHRPFSQHMNSKNISERKTAVLEYYHHIKALVEPSAFLDFDYEKHGWAELSAFLGIPAPSPGTPFPRLRSKTISRVALKWQMDPGKSCVFASIMLASILANLLLFLFLVHLIRHLKALVCRQSRGKRE